MSLEKSFMVYATFSIKRFKDAKAYHETAKILVSSVTVKN